MFYPCLGIANKAWRSIYFTLLILLSVSFSVSTSANEWSDWLQQQIQQHPDLIAARERMNASVANADALEKPRFNPELETEFEQNGDINNYRVGITQTIDLWNARGASRRQAGFERLSADQQYKQNYQHNLSVALLLLIELNAASEQANIAREQEAQIETLIDLVERRLQAGDVSAADSALTYLSLSQQLNETARSQVRLQGVTALLRDLLPELSEAYATIPEAFWGRLMNRDIDVLVDSNPRVLLAKSNADALQQAAIVTQRANKAAPTIGVNSGQEEEEDVIGVTFSIPINIRNNYNAQARAAAAEALAAEADYRAVRREQRARLESIYAEYEQWQDSFERWNSRVASRLASSGALLEQQWRAGDLSTGDYLIALQQRANALIAGIELLSDRRKAFVEWLLQSGQLVDALNTL